MLQLTAYVQQTINILPSGSYFLSFYCMYNNGNNNIQIILDSSQCDQLRVANTQTLWTLYNL